MRRLFRMKNKIRGRFEDWFSVHWKWREGKTALPMETKMFQKM
jgi:hypothetical protein